MTRCPGCGDVVSRVPHTRSDASECDGRVYDLALVRQSVLDANAADAAAFARLSETRTDLAPIDPARPPVFQTWGAELAEQMAPLAPETVDFTAIRGPLFGVDLDAPRAADDVVTFIVPAPPTE